MSPWEGRVEQDADLVYQYMSDQYGRGRRRPFSIAELQRAVRITRERICGALVVLVMIRKSAGVDGDSAEASTFYPIL